MVLKDQTILITGGCGDIGSTLVEKFYESSKKVIVIDNNKDGLVMLKKKL